MKTNKDELLADFKLVLRKKRDVFAMMIILCLMNIPLFIAPIVTLDGSLPKMKVRFSDIYTRVFSQEVWYYMLAFSLLAVVLGLGHNLIALRLTKKRGAAVAKLFLGASIMVTVFAFAFLMRILTEPR